MLGRESNLRPAASETPPFSLHHSENSKRAPFLGQKYLFNHPFSAQFFSGVSPSKDSPNLSSIPPRRLLEEQSPGRGDHRLKVSGSKTGPPGGTGKQLEGEGLGSPVTVTVTGEGTLAASWAAGGLEGTRLGAGEGPQGRVG